MMIYSSEDFHAPSDGTAVWRYMDLTKLLSILEKRALFFPTIETLRKTDPWEGSWQNFKAGQSVGETSWGQSIFNDLVKPSMSEAASKRVCVSCWYMQEHESMAMWKLYLTGNEGIAIRTNFAKLIKSFQFDHSSWPCYVEEQGGSKSPLIPAKVEYIDWNEPPNNTNTLKQHIYKGIPFEHEHELRILVQLHGVVNMPAFLLGERDETFGLRPEVLQQVNEYGGVYLPIDPWLLIENIYIVPTASKWFAELVKDICKRYGLDGHKIVWSNQRPLY